MPPQLIFGISVLLAFVVWAGASSGVGQSTARLLARENYKVIGIPTHLSLPSFGSAALNLTHD
jgi:hypothetical protein